MPVLDSIGNRSRSDQFIIWLLLLLFSTILDRPSSAKQTEQKRIETSLLAERYYRV